jgi:hypothetical protein
VPLAACSLMCEDGMRGVARNVEVAWVYGYCCILHACCCGHSSFACDHGRGAANLSGGKLVLTWDRPSQESSRGRSGCCSKTDLYYVPISETRVRYGVDRTFVLCSLAKTCPAFLTCLEMSLFKGMQNLPKVI